MQLGPTFLDRPSPCGYLPDRDWTLESRWAFQLSADEYAARMLGGWRRFGRTLFRPRCQHCQECRPLRVDVARFCPDRSQRRARRANEADVSLQITHPEATAENIALYQRYHAYQAQARQWPTRTDEGRSEYTDTFVDNPFPSEEWRYRVGDRLVGVGYVDRLGVGLSAITFIHDPAERSRSLGTWNVLSLIDQARQSNLPHVYLGYLVEPCGSMAYKARFRPNEVRTPAGRWEHFRGCGDH